VPTLASLIASIAIRPQASLADMPTLLAVPNVAEGADEQALADAEAAFTRGTTLLDRHSDADHHRTVFTLAGGPGPLTDALVWGAEVAIEKIDISGYTGAHPAIGALDVCPVVWLDPVDHDVARTEAVSVATQIGGLGVPVFLYGELARGPGRAERAYFRNGGLAELWLRMEAGELRPDFGPPLPHRHGGATLVTARPPLAAFNVELDSGDLEVARSVAAGLRESGGGLPGVRAIGLLLSSGRTQVSTNVHDPLAVPLGRVVEAVRELAAPLGARPLEAELVGLIPAAALDGYPEDVPMRGFDPAKHVIERRLAALTD
jgi:glutamate formiminotransferase